MKRVYATPHAEAQILEIGAWWLANREKAPSLFEEELEDAFNVIAEMHDAGKAWHHPTIPGVRRIILKKTKYHVYYVERADHVRILAVWGGPRGVRPDFG